MARFFLIFAISIILSHAAIGSGEEKSGLEPSRKKRGLSLVKYEDDSSKEVQEPEKRSKKAGKKSDDEKASSLFAPEKEVTLKQGKGSKDTGGGKGGFHWSIFWNDKRAGKVYINMVDLKPIGLHPSIQIYLNKSSQGRHIGRVAYQKACEASNYDTIYAHMKKSNLASRKAAEAAGFKAIKMAGITQLLLRWVRKG
jgi:hypothetical protein